MRDKISVATVATSGIGAATALGVARLGATVVIVGRNADKCSGEVRKIQKKTGNKSPELKPNYAHRKPNQRVCS